jgi:hypothetical protein
LKYSSFQTIYKSKRRAKYSYRNKLCFKANLLSVPIQFNESDETNCFPVKGSEVNIVTSSEGDHDVGSFMLKNIDNFGWEPKYYPEQLVAAHMSGIYIAYAITTPGKGCRVVKSGDQGH